jgi:hypothetical protein
VAGISVAVFALPIFIDKTKLTLAFAAVVAEGKRQKKKK